VLARTFSAGRGKRSPKDLSVNQDSKTHSSCSIFHLLVTLLQLIDLTPDHLPAILSLDQRCFGGHWTLDGYQRELDSPNSELFGFQACLQAETKLPTLLAIGCYWAILEEAHITILGIDPGYQHQGLGQAMLHALLHSAHQRGLERATLEVRASNQPALALYAKFGFREAGRRKRYYQDTGEDALVLWLNGLQYPQFVQSLQQWESEVGDRLRLAGWQGDRLS